MWCERASERTYVEFVFVEVSQQAEWNDVVDAKSQRLKLLLDAAQKPPRYVQPDSSTRAAASRRKNTQHFNYNEAVKDRSLRPRCCHLIRLREVVPCVRCIQRVFLRAVYS